MHMTRPSPHDRQHLSDPHQTWDGLSDPRTATETLDKSKWHQAAAIDGMCHWQLPATVEEFLVDARNTEDNETVKMSKSNLKACPKTNKSQTQRESKDRQRHTSFAQFDLSLRMPLLHLVSGIIADSTSV